MPDTCVVCMVNSANVKVKPCGHDPFCETCARKFRTCPLCRVPLELDAEGLPYLEQSVRARTPLVQKPKGQPMKQTDVLSKQEKNAIFFIGFVVWLFIFIGGLIEWKHGIPVGCEAGDPVGHGYLQVPGGTQACDDCREDTQECKVCKEGFLNYGANCYKYLENTPSVKTGAALGGPFYFGIIVATQACGILTEIALIVRLRRRHMMPSKELIVLACALFIEITRMFLVDLFVLQEYFGGREYSIFREPLPCDTPTPPGAWMGADGQAWCDDMHAHSAATRYFIAASKEAFSGDSAKCSLFTGDSALLDFGVATVSAASVLEGAPRFANLGWVIGGEFAMYYWFATFINEVADNMFVVPSTSKNGMLCKIFSVALEVFQLGALCPAAVFTHTDCLHYTDPFGTSLHLISGIIVAFGYCIWGFLFICVPLAAMGLVILGGFACLAVLLGICGKILITLGDCIAGCSSRCRRIQRVGLACGSAGNFFVEGSQTVLKHMENFQASAKKGGEAGAIAVMVMAFLPLLCGGIFLGTLVVVGQGSKEGFMQVLTAIVLLSDVLFKIIATAVTETVDYMLHLRVVRAVESGAQHRPPTEKQNPDSSMRPSKVTRIVQFVRRSRVARAIANIRPQKLGNADPENPDLSMKPSKVGVDSDSEI